jgi:hypothetical protein
MVYRLSSRLNFPAQASYEKPAGTPDLVMRKIYWRKDDERKKTFYCPLTDGFHHLLSYRSFESPVQTIFYNCTYETNLPFNIAL